MAFRFGDNKGFSADLASFLAHMEAADPEMGAILRAHVNGLLSATDDAERRGARFLFNLSVTPQLDELLAQQLEKTSG